MKIILFLFTCIIILSCQPNQGTEQEVKSPTHVENKKGKSMINCKKDVFEGLSFPSWLEGTWVNLTESRASHIETFGFHDKRLSVQQGFRSENGRRITHHYDDYSIREMSGDSIYSFDFVKENHSLRYEFILQKIEAFEGDDILIYAIWENVKEKRKHLRSCQNVLFREKIHRIKKEETRNPVNQTLCFNQKTTLKKPNRK